MIEAAGSSVTFERDGRRATFHRPHPGKEALRYRGYTASMSFDPQDHIIVGRVEGIDDIVTFHAEGVKEFERHFHEVVDDYIAACDQLGGKAEKPASGNLMLRIDPNLHATALKISQRQGLSLNKWAEQALRAATLSGVEV